MSVMFLVPAHWIPWEILVSVWRIRLGLLQPAGTCHRVCVTELKDPILMCLPLTHKFIVWQEFDSQNGAVFAQ